MSLVLTLAQRAAVHVLTDAATYRNDGTLVSNNFSKCIAIPTAGVAVSAIGPAECVPLFATVISQKFRSLDEIVAGAEVFCKAFMEIERGRDGDTSTSVYVAGWLRSESRPAAFCIEMMSDQYTERAALIRNSPGSDSILNRFKENRGICGSPLPPVSDIKSSGFVIRGDAAAYDAAIDLLHVATLARQTAVDGKYCIGGKAVLTSIGKNAITQRVLREWAGDQVGEKIVPTPVTDWADWRRQQRRAARRMELQ